jgi:hypothetical protein
VGDEDLVAEHRAAVEARDWETARELERRLVTATDNTERPEDGDQPPQAAGG